MTTPGRVQRHRQAEAARRRVRATGVRRIGKRTTIPKRKPPARKRTKYQHAGALAGLSLLFSTFAFMTGSMFWAVGACASAAGSGIAGRLAYRAELAQVKRTGRPIGQPQRAPKPDPQRPPEPEPIDLDQLLRRPKPQEPQPAARRPVGAAHAAKCKAKPPGGPTCRCPDGPNRRGGAKKTTTRRRSK